MAQDPQFTATPKVGKAKLTAANPNRDGTGTIVSGFAAGANGSRVEYAVVKASVSTTAGMVRVFVHDGTTADLLTEIPVNPVNVAANTPAFETITTFLNGMVLPPGYSLRFSTEKAEAITVTCFGGDF